MAAIRGAGGSVDGSKGCGGFREHGEHGDGFCGPCVCVRGVWGAYTGKEGSCAGVAIMVPIVPILPRFAATCCFGFGLSGDASPFHHPILSVDLPYPPKEKQRKARDGNY